MAGFTPAERKVARALLAGPPTIGLEPSALLARHVGVSGPTVIRFVNRLGFARYGDFQDALREELGARLLSPVTRYAKRPRPKNADPLEAASDALSETLAGSLRDLPPDEFRQAVSMLSDPARRVVIFGGWFSDALARYLAALLQEMRPGVRFIDHSASQRAAAIMEVRRKDIAVIFDYRRYDEETLEFARDLHAAGAQLVLFTDRWLSPVSDVARVVLPTMVETALPFDTLAPAMATVEVLAAAIIGSGGEATESRFEQFNKVAERLAPRWGVPAEPESG